MPDIISQDIAGKLKDVKGEVRGMSIKSHGDFILKEKGKEGLEKLEQMMAELGFPMKHEKIQSWEFYPIGMEVVELLAIKKLFDFNDEKIEEIGSFESISSLVIRIFLRHFISLKTMAEQAPVIWGKYYTVGSLKVEEMSEEKRYAILVLKDFNIHPIYCFHLKGYLSSVLKMVVGGKVTCQETKCFFQGGGRDRCHEFLFKW